MKRYLLFQYPEYYPSGGLSDVSKEFDTYNEAMDYIKDNPESISDSNYLFDCKERITVWEYVN